MLYRFQQEVQAFIWIPKKFENIVLAVKWVILMVRAVKVIIKNIIKKFKWHCPILLLKMLYISNLFQNHFFLITIDYCCYVVLEYFWSNKYPINNSDIKALFIKSKILFVKQSSKWIVNINMNDISEIQILY